MFTHLSFAGACRTAQPHVVEMVRTASAKTIAELVLIMAVLLNGWIDADRVNGSWSYPNVECRFNESSERPALTMI